MATKANIFIDQGTDFTGGIQIFDSESNTVQNISDWIFTGYIKKAYNSNTHISFSFDNTTAGANGVVYFSVNSSITSAAQTGRYVYDIEALDSANNHLRIVEGIATFNPEVTRVGHSNNLVVSPEDVRPLYLNDLADVTVSSVQDGDILIYHSANLQWINSDTDNFLKSNSSVTLTGEITFDAETQRPAFLLGANTTDQLIPGLNAEFLDGYDASYFLDISNMQSGTIDPARLPLANTSSPGIVTLIDSVSNSSTSLVAVANSVKTAYDAAISANTNAANASFLSSGTVAIARLPTANLSSSGIITLNDSISNNSINFAATSNSVKTAYDAAITANTNAANASFLNNGTVSTNLLPVANTSSAGIVTLIDSVSNTSINISATANSVKLAYETALTANTNAANASFLSSGTVAIARLPVANTTSAGITTLVDSISNTSFTLAPTANSVKTAYDAAITANTNAANASFLNSGILDSALLANSGVTPGTYGNTTYTPSIVIDAKGRITSASSVQIASSNGGGSSINQNDVGYDVLLFIGQSNMEGYGLNYDANLDFSDSRIEKWGTISGNTYYNTQYLAKEPNIPIGLSDARVASSLAFARWYVSIIPQNRKVLIVNCSVGSTQLFGSRWAAPSGDLYQAAVAFANAAIGAGTNNRITGILWLQGEWDAYNNVLSDQYNGALDNLIDSLRTNITGATNCPFLIGGMVPDWVADPTVTPGVTVDDVQEIYTSHATAPYRRAYVSFVPGPSGLTNNSANNDRIHYNAAGQREMGKRFFFTGWFNALLNTPASILAPSAPATLTAYPQTSTTTLVSWSSVTNAGFYEVDYKLNSSNTWTSVTHVGSVLSRTISSLSNGQLYNYRVRARNLTGNSSYTTTSATQIVVPTQVTGLTSTTITASAITLTWNAASNSPTDYIVEYKLNSSGTWLTFSDGVSTSTTATVTGLAALSLYNFRVTATNSGGNGPASTTYSASTIDVAPGQVTGLTVGTITASTVDLSWTVPGSGGAPTDYIVEYKLNSSGTWLTFSDGTSTTTNTTVTGLTDSSLYNFRVTATNSGGNGTPSSTVNATTAAITSPPGQVTGLTIGTVTATTVALSWTAATNNPTDYIIEYKQSSSGTWLTFSDGTSTATNTTVTGLTPSTSYDFRVTGTNSFGDGTPSTTATTTTSALPTISNALFVYPTWGGSPLLAITWTLSGGTASQVVIQYRVAGSGGSYTVISPTSSSSTGATIALNPTSSWEVQLIGANTVNMTWTGLPQPFVLLDIPNATLVSGNTISSVPSIGSNTTAFSQANTSRRPTLVSVGTGLGISTGISQSLVGGPLPLGSYTKSVLVNLNDFSGWGNFITSSIANTANVHAAWRSGTTGTGFNGTNSANLFMGHTTPFSAVGNTIPLVANTWYVLSFVYDVSITNGKIYIDNTLAANGNLAERVGAELNMGFNEYLNTASSGNSGRYAGVDVFSGQALNANQISQNATMLRNRVGL